MALCLPPVYPGRRAAVPAELTDSEAHMARNSRGKKPNAEDRQGDKTHWAFIEGLIKPEEQSADATDRSKPIAGHHRLHENREQHDEAEKDSEVTETERLGD